MVEKILYHKLNTDLIYDEDTETYKVFSFNTLVFKMVNKNIEIDARGTHKVNYDGRQSPTTSKHITQALNYIDSLY